MQLITLVVLTACLAVTASANQPPMGALFLLRYALLMASERVCISLGECDSCFLLLSPLNLSDRIRSGNRCEPEDPKRRCCYGYCHKPNAKWEEGRCR